jgi:hypothetical protein
MLHQHMYCREQHIEVEKSHSYVAFLADELLPVKDMQVQDAVPNKHMHALQMLTGEASPRSKPHAKVHC